MRRIVIAGAMAVVLATACGGASDDGPTTTAGQPATGETTTTEAAPTTTDATPTTTAAPGDVTATITIAGFDFGPPVSVAVGETVSVVNTDSLGHTWTAEDGTFSSGVIGPDESYEYTFESSGEYAFFCGIHPSMTGTITVNG